MESIIISIITALISSLVTGYVSKKKIESNQSLKMAELESKLQLKAIELANTAMTEVIHQLKLEIDDLKKDNVQLKESIKEYIDKIRLLSDQGKSSQMLIVALRSEIGLLKNTIDMLKGTIKTYQIKLENSHSPGSNI